MTPYIGPELGKYLLEGRWDSQKPLEMSFLAPEHHRDDDNPQSLLRDDDEISNQHIWPEIRYLDPARNCPNHGRPVVVPIVALLLTWTILFAALISCFL